MIKAPGLSCLLMALVMLGGCAQKIYITEPISFQQHSAGPIPVFVGVVLEDATANYILRGSGPGRTGVTGGGVQVFLGQAVKDNLDSFLKTVFRDVAVANSIEALPPDVTHVAILRFSPQTRLYMPFSVFTETQLVVALDMEVRDKAGMRAWKVKADGDMALNHPMQMGGLESYFGNNRTVALFYKSLASAAVQLAFNDLETQIRFNQEKWSGDKTGRL